MNPRLIPVLAAALTLAACGASRVHTVVITASAPPPPDPTTSSTTSTASSGNANSDNGSNPSLSCTYANGKVTATVSNYGYTGGSITGGVIIVDADGAWMNGGEDNQIGLTGNGPTATGHDNVYHPPLDTDPNSGMMLNGTAPYSCVLVDLAASTDNGNVNNYLYQDQTVESAEQNSGQTISTAPPTVASTINGLTASALPASPAASSGG